MRPVPARTRGGTYRLVVVVHTLHWSWILPLRRCMRSTAGSAPLHYPGCTRICYLGSCILSYYGWVDDAQPATRTADAGLRTTGICCLHTPVLQFAPIWTPVLTPRCGLPTTLTDPAFAHYTRSGPKPLLWMDTAASAAPSPLAFAVVYTLTYNRTLHAHNDATLYHPRWPCYLIHHSWMRKHHTAARAAAVDRYWMRTYTTAFTP